MRTCFSSLVLELFTVSNFSLVGVQEVFRFGGVYCGARASIPFTVSNKVGGDNGP